MQNNASSNGERHRHFRVVTLLAFVPGFSLLLPYGIVTAKPLPAVGIAPLFFSASSGALVLTGRLMTPGAKAWIDVMLAAFFISVLIPSWIAIKKQGNNGWADAGNVMLASYGTAVMMASFAIHFYLGILALWSGDIELPTIVWQSSVCPDCQHHQHHHRSVSVGGHRIGFPGVGTVYPHEHGNKEVREPFMHPRNEDEESRDSSEYQTSGFNSPRRSAETLATDMHHDITEATDN